MSVEIGDAAEGKPADRFTLTVKVDGKQVEQYPDVTVKRGKDNVVRAVAERSKVITLTEVATATQPAKGTVALTAPLASRTILP